MFRLLIPKHVSEAEGPMFTFYCLWDIEKCLKNVIENITLKMLVNLKKKQNQGINIENGLLGPSSQRHNNV